MELSENSKRAGFWMASMSGTWKNQDLCSASRGKNQGMEILSQIHQPRLHSSVIINTQTKRVCSDPQGDSVCLSMIFADCLGFHLQQAYWEKKGSFFRQIRRTSRDIATKYNCPANIAICQNRRCFSKHIIQNLSKKLNILFILFYI